MTDPIHLFTLLTLALGFAYFFTGLYLLAQKHPEKKKPLSLPRVAVLIAMRNEEAFIGNCLQSLTWQDYPKHLFDVYILDDRSTDRSAEIAEKITEKRTNFHIYSITDDQNGLKGKMNVLAQGISATDHEIILITDADCVLPATWISTQVSYFDDQTGMVGGMTSLAPGEHTPAPGYKPNLFADLQALDWLYLQTLAAGSAAAGKPITILGNNFGFRRKAYEAVGGFETLGFSVTEDFALMKALSDQTEWQIRYTVDTQNMIFSQPVESFGAFVKQRLRWTKGGRRARPFAYAIVGLSVLAHLAILLTFAFQVWKNATALALGLIIGMDFYIIRHITRITGLQRLRPKFWLYELFYIFNLVTFTVLTLWPLKIKWKSRTF